MKKSSHRSTPGRTAYSRRAVLSVSALGLLTLAGCADQTSDRQFAGDRRTDVAGATEDAGSTGVPVAGSPTAIPTQMPVSQLLAPRADRTSAIATLPDRLVVVDVVEATGRESWSDAGRAVWAAELSPASTEVALLTSRAEAPVDWAVEFVDMTKEEIVSVDIGNRQRGGDQDPDVVAGGRGGIAWLPDSSSVVIALPTGGLLQVFADGSQVRVAKAAAAKRPSALAVSPDGSTIAFVDRPSGSDGSGIFAGSMKAKPIDPIVVLPADRSGNRYAREVAWVGTTARVATIIDREETGTTQGDLFVLDTQTKMPNLVWTSPVGRDVASVEAFAISPDAMVTAFLTNPVRRPGTKPSSVWLGQTDGPAIERFDLPVGLSGSRLAFTSEGVAITGTTRTPDTGGSVIIAFLLNQSGTMSLLYRQESAATPVASPVASPSASPAPASPTPEE